MKLVDLFCGCGGFSLGAHRAGFEVSAAFDLDPTLTSSFERNFPKTKLLVEDVAFLTGDRLNNLVGEEVSGIFGGPPCQGFSSIGRRDKNDPRRLLLGHFFRIVDEVRPKFFVMENVRGLAFSDSLTSLETSIEPLTAFYNILGPIVLDAAEFGAATRRKRLFVIGIRSDCGNSISEADIRSFERPSATVRDAISDLDSARSLKRGSGQFDQWRVPRRGKLSHYAEMLRSADGIFTSHRKVTHKQEVAARFAEVLPGSTDKVGRHPKLAWDGQCPTLRAGTGPDKGSRQAVRPLHPEYPRVITVREAARLQGFPDGHLFHPTHWHSFRMIGNSVSPLVAEAVFRAIKSKLTHSAAKAVASS
jgi:DNA (cytosine-5)-methyltransferase 1